MSVKYCESCGTSVMETMRFCPQCGHRIFSLSPVQTKPAKVFPNPTIQNINSNSNQTSINYAGFWERVAAYLIDLCLTSLVSFLGGYVLGLLLTIGGVNVALSSSQALIYLLDFVALIFYYALMESSVQKGTLGKQWLGLEVTDMNYNQITLSQGVGRYFGRFISALLVGVGYFMQPFTAKRQTLHDIMAHTLVVKKGSGKSAIVIASSTVLSFIVLCVLLAVIKAINHSI